MSLRRKFKNFLHSIKKKIFFKEQEVLELRETVDRSYCGKNNFIHV